MCASMVGVDADANPDDSVASDEAMLARLATELADAVESSLGGWVVASVVRIHTAWSGSCPPQVRDAAAAAGAEATAVVGPAVRVLLATDPDDQRVNPLQIIRTATAYPTAVLRDAGVPAVERDAEAVRQFPDDVYDLTPMGFADLAPGVHDPGIAWGAGKAHVVLARRRREGRR
jgi:hypothetical protein